MEELDIGQKYGAAESPVTAGAEGLPLKGGRAGLMSQLVRMWRSLGYYYRREGLRGLAARISARLVRYHRFGVFEVDLSRPVTAVPADIPVNVRRLSESEADIDRLVRFWPEMYAPPQSSPARVRELVLRRLAAGEECLFAEHAGEIVYMNWHGFQNTFIFNPQAAQRGLSADEALSYNTYCVPSFRGRGIHDAVISEMLRRLREKGIKKLITYVLTDNIISGKSMARVTAGQVQVQRCITLLGLNFYFLSKRVS